MEFQHIGTHAMLLVNKKALFLGIRFRTEILL